MNDKELLEYIAAQVGKLTTQVDTLTKDMSEVKSRLTSVENIVTRIENDHGEKLVALFDGYKQHTDQLDRIEKEVSKHDEFILKRIK